MIAHWILCNVGSPDRIQELSYAIRECGRTFDILSLKETYELTEVVNETPACNIFRGSLNLSIELGKARPNWKGLLHSHSDYLCSRYYSYWGDYITQNNYFMLTFSELCRKWNNIFDKFSVNGKLFIRPNSNEKEFNGAVVHAKNKDAWYSDCEIRNVNPEELCVIAQPIEIENEIRLIIADCKVIAGSLYREFGTIMHIPIESQPDYHEIVEFAEKRLKELSFPAIHCLDIATVHSKYTILEVGCFCCCGLYQCDLHKVANGVSNCVENL